MKKKLDFNKIGFCIVFNITLIALIHKIATCGISFISTIGYFG